MIWKRRAAFAALFVLFLAIYDVWFWQDPHLLFGLPIGLTYHIIIALAAVGVLTLVVRYAPAFAGSDEESDS